MRKTCEEQEKGGLWLVGSSRSRHKTAMTSVWPSSQFTPTSSLHAQLSFCIFKSFSGQTKSNQTLLFQAKNVEEPRIRSELQNQASGAEGRVGVREGEGVWRPGQAPGGDTSNTSIDFRLKALVLVRLEALVTVEPAVMLVDHNDTALILAWAAWWWLLHSIDMM